MRLVVGHHVPGCGQAVAGKSMRFGACICYVPRRGFTVHRDDGAAVVLESTAVKKHVFFGQRGNKSPGLDEENWPPLYSAALSFGCDGRVPRSNGAAVICHYKPEKALIFRP